jgi:uncharacterized protein YbjT (DUF2867 family)
VICVSAIVVVFGGTGFLGRRIVRRLRTQPFTVRAASRNPQRVSDQLRASDAGLEPVAADIHDERSVAASVAGARAVVNAVSLYVERRAETFQSVHVAGAERLARLARAAGVERLIHISGIGADPGSSSAYIRSRGHGEQVVRRAFPEATLIRPCVMFGPDDAFVTTILALLRRLPVYPMFGRGETRLQPVHVEDVAEAVARVIGREDSRGATFECGGPRVFSYDELIATIARAAQLQVRRYPVSFAVWRGLARLAEALPRPALTRNQVELMQVDTVVSPHARSLADLGIQPSDIERAAELIAFPEATA